MKILLATTLGAALSLGSLCAFAANSTPTTAAAANAPSEQPGTDAWITTSNRRRFVCGRIS